VIQSDEWERSPFRIKYAPADLRVFATPRAFRAAMFGIVDFHNSQAHACKTHLGPFLQALKPRRRDVSLSRHLQNLCPDREYPEIIRQSEEREKRRREKAEAKKLQK
jgi:hypothetical protein